jgi:hypothetical protein
MKKTKTTWSIGLFVLALSTFGSKLVAQSHDTEEVAMMRGVNKQLKNGWDVDPIFTVGETDNDGTDYSQDRFGYRVPGVPDGMYAFAAGFGRVNLFLNSELSANRGYPYTLANGTVLIGARVTRFRIQENFFTKDRGISNAALAYNKIIDRYYNEVTDASQINEGSGGPNDGLNRLCSASGIERFKYGFRNDIFFTGEETGDGGQEFILDVNNEVLYCAPAMGRAAWESVTVMENFGSNKVVVLIGDDRGGAPLLLYVGQRNQSFTNNAPQFLKRNGLAKGYLFVWVADNGDRDPEAWNGTGTARSGKFVRIEHWNPSQAGQAGWDNAGWADQATQDDHAEAVGYFKFSRPEDVATNPVDGTQAVLASTGRDSQFPSDSWGTTYLVDLNASALYSALHGPLNGIEELPADISIIYDGDDAGNGQFAGPDYGLRSPDNLEWADDGFIYINEDRSVGGFCSTSGREASVWQVNPNTGELTRILEMDRSAVPFEQFDSAPNDCGNWESSGTIDVTRFFRTEPNETVLLLNVQAHSNDDDVKSDSPIGGDDDLSEGGQLIFVSKVVDPITEGPINRNYSEISDEEETEIGSSIEIYPNPADNVLNLSEESNYQMFDFLGNKVLEGPATRTIDVSSLKPGIYVLKTSDAISHKIFIE